MDMLRSDKTGMLTQNIMTIESKLLWCETSQQGLLSFALLASEGTQNAKDVCDTMLFKSKQEVQADLDCHTSLLLAFRSCCRDDRIPCCGLLSQSCRDQGGCGCASVVACWLNGACGVQASHLPTQMENGFSVGISHLSDPPRPDTKDVNFGAGELGIQVKIITGDHVAVKPRKSVA